jgi:hypothetical protein
MLFDTETESRADYREWLLMPRLQSQRERTIRCAYPTETGVPCGARPETEDRSAELPALQGHVRARHLGGLAADPFGRLVAAGVSYPIKDAPFAYLYTLGDPAQTPWCFAGSEREYTAWVSTAPAPPDRVEAPVEASYAF